MHKNFLTLNDLKFHEIGSSPSAESGGLASACICNRFQDYYWPYVLVNNNLISCLATINLLLQLENTLPETLELESIICCFFSCAIPHASFFLLCSIFSRKAQTSAVVKHFLKQQNQRLFSITNSRFWSIVKAKNFEKFGDYVVFYKIHTGVSFLHG